MKYTPLPASLSGEIVERLIRVDKSLLYLISGALEYVTDREPYDETGALTIAEVREALGEMIWTYYQESPQMAIIGEVRFIAGDSIPDKWLWCNGASLLRAEFSDLFGAIGLAYTTGGDDDHFQIPDLQGRSPMGSGVPSGGTTNVLRGQKYGEQAHTLTVPEIPPHAHQQSAPNNTALVTAGGAGGANNRSAATVATTSTTPNVTQDTGGGDPHNNIHPVTVGNFIIYAGV